jgi:thymidine phosphorylase
LYKILIKRILFFVLFDKGGGRLKSTDTIDFTVGIRLLKHVGDSIQTNEPWAILYANNDALKHYPKFLNDLNASLVVSSAAVEPLKRIYKVLT